MLAGILTGFGPGVALTGVNPPLGGIIGATPKLPTTPLFAVIAPSAASLTLISRPDNPCSIALAK